MTNNVKEDFWRLDAQLTSWGMAFDIVRKADYLEEAIKGVWLKFEEINRFRIAAKHLMEQEAISGRNSLEIGNDKKDITI